MSTHGKQIMQAVTLILEGEHSIEVKEQVRVGETLLPLRYKVDPVSLLVSETRGTFLLSCVISFPEIEENMARVCRFLGCVTCHMY
jgi:hypothetical protein